MRKTLSLLLAVCLFMTAFSVNAFAADSSQEANAKFPIDAPSGILICGNVVQA